MLDGIVDAFLASQTAFSVVHSLLVARFEVHGRMKTVVRNVALDLVGRHLLDSLFDAMHDQFISCPYD